jgi:hypothetical protein
MLEQAFGYFIQWYSPELEQGFAADPPPKIVHRSRNFFGTKKASCLYLRGGGGWPTALTKSRRYFIGAPEGCNVRQLQPARSAIEPLAHTRPV